MYQAILFDLDDTLISLRGCESEALQRTLSAAGLLRQLPADFTLVAESFARTSSGYWAARTVDGHMQYTREQITEHSLRDFLREYSLDVIRSERLAEQYWTEFCRSKAITPGALDTLNHLSRPYRLGMITNGYIDSQRGRLKATGLTRYFDPILISEEVGVAKPDAAIFELALAALQLGRDEVLYIGDSISHDYQGCLNAGIDFCHYYPDSRDDSGLPRVKYRIRQLRELHDLLLTQQ